MDTAVKDRITEIYKETKKLEEFVKKISELDFTYSISEYGVTVWIDSKKSYFYVFQD